MTNFFFLINIYCKLIILKNKWLITFTLYGIDKNKIYMDKKKITIGRYLVIKTIGTGGMGEVLLAYDPICKRNVALKKIRQDLAENEMIKNRFLKEAKIASRLTHPSIVPIFSIHNDSSGIYYTMPYVEGEMLKDILIEANEDASIQSSKGSISNLIRIFLNVCEAVAYTHSKNILHRDLKPNNIIIGKYGEVMILDWGIADFIDKIKEESSQLDINQILDEDEKAEITKPGKISGTVTFMAPERAFGENASILTDIYALGVILYQILTLSSPFQRRSLAHFRKIAKSEKLIDPIEKAPYRDVPHQLSEICKKCLSYEKEKRYQNVQDLIRDVINFIEGRPEWVFATTLDIYNKEHWAIAENVFLPKHTALTPNSDEAEWVSLLLAKIAISGNIKIEADIILNDESSGIGFLLSVPEPDTKFAIEEGYFLWLGFQNYPVAQLIRSNALVMEVKEINLIPNTLHHILIEKDENSFRFYLDDKIILTYGTLIPLAGTHLGLIHTDLNFEIKNFKVYSASHNVMVNCLAVPDAFLAKKQYDTAYSEYKRISQSFPGRMEGLQALFRAGIALLEKAKSKNNKKGFQQALDEFDHLHHTAGAPLEYLGKAFVYATLQEYEEEAKCLELAIRKFQNHPLLPIVREHIIYRIHESSLQDREATYRLLLLTILHIPSLKENPDTLRLIHNMQDHWEKLYFISSSKYSLEIELAFRLGRKNTLLEIFSKLSKNEKEHEIDIKNIFFSLLELGAIEEISKILNKDKYPLFNLLKKSHTEDLDLLEMDDFFSKKLSLDHIKALIHIFRQALDKNSISFLKKHINRYKIPKEDSLVFDCLNIWFRLLTKDYVIAKKIFEKYPIEMLNNDSTLLFPLYGIWLYVSESPDIAKIHFSAVLEYPYPKTTSLLSHFLTEKIDKWLKHALFFEKKELYRQLSLFYLCKGEKKKQKYFSDLCLKGI